MCYIRLGSDFSPSRSRLQIQQLSQIEIRGGDHLQHGKGIEDLRIHAAKDHLSAEQNPICTVRYDTGNMWQQCYHVLYQGGMSNVHLFEETRG